MKNKLFALIIALFCIVSIGQANAQSIKISDNRDDAKMTENVEVDTNGDLEPLKSYIQTGYKGAKETFNKMIIGYKNKNLDQVLSTIADNKEVVFFGTGARYILIGKEEIKKAFTLDFNTIENIDIKVPWLSIRGKEDVAWLSSIVDLKLTMNGVESDIEARQTMVFEKFGDDWKIVNSHFSFPAMEAQTTILEDEVEEVEGVDKDVKNIDEKMEKIEEKVNEEVQF